MFSPQDSQQNDDIVMDMKLVLPFVPTLPGRTYLETRQSTARD